MHPILKTYVDEGLSNMQQSFMSILQGATTAQQSATEINTYVNTILHQWQLQAQIALTNRHDAHVALRLPLEQTEQLKRKAEDELRENVQMLNKHEEDALLKQKQDYEEAERSRATTVKDQIDRLQTRLTGCTTMFWHPRIPKNAETEPRTHMLCVHACPCPNATLRIDAIEQENKKHVAGSGTTTRPRLRMV